jgi:phosphoribosylformylglycinamidine synthase
VHLNRVLEKPAILQGAQILAIPGGFSYGDDISSGKIFANQLRMHLADALRNFVAAGKPIIGICNGFQILVKAGMLPGPMDGTVKATLTNNDCHRFVDRWIHLKPVSKKCIWLRELPVASCQLPVNANANAKAPAANDSYSQLATRNSQLFLSLPIAHGEGKYVPANETSRRALWDGDQVALVYARADGAAASGQFPDNPNGSIDDIAGVCDATGLVLGLMPHPERYVDPRQHPAWSSQSPLPAVGAGLAIFQSAVNYVGGGVS